MLPPYEYEQKDNYSFPKDWWRVLLHVLGFLFTLVMIINEIWDFILSKRKHDRWKLWREKELQKVRHCAFKKSGKSYNCGFFLHFLAVLGCKSM